VGVIEMNSVRVYISTKTVITAVLTVVTLIFLYQIRDVLILLFACFVIASALYSSVDWMSQKVPRGLVIGLIYLVGFIVFLTLLVPFINVINIQSNLFIQKFPLYWGQLSKIISNLQLMAYKSGVSFDYSGISAGVTDLSKNIVSHSINITINFFLGIVTAFTLAVIVLFILLDKESLKQNYLGIFPKKYRENIEHITYTIARKVGGYARGQVILMLAVGILTGVGLHLIGIEFALLLGIIAGVLEIIPIAGPIIASVPAVIIGLSHSPLTALKVIILYIIIQRIENNFLTPLILGKFLELHPLVIIIAILMAASTLGIYGVILSPAIAASLYVLFQELYLKKIEQENV
jgi:predicted PurR-regulated permease PerM